MLALVGTVMSRSASGNVLLRDGDGVLGTHRPKCISSQGRFGGGPDQDLSDGLVVGEEWGQRLHERLRWADAVVCLLTSAYLASVWCTAELATAQNRGEPAVAGAGRDRGEPSAAEGGAAG